MNSIFEIRHSQFSSVRLNEEHDARFTIKRGERPWPDVNAWRLRLHKGFDEAFASIQLPERPDYVWANEFFAESEGQKDWRSKTGIRASWKIPWRIPRVGSVMLPEMSDTDLELLARYTRQHAEDAFAELVQRHLGLVYSAALRQVRSPQLAEEVAQSTFIKLVSHAPRLTADTILTAWLYQVTRREAIDVVRREASRQLREQIATEMNAMNATAADWTHIEPLLDEAMHALDDTDRAAVLLRYFENKSLREVGATLGTSENAAQKRLGRAVERLREFLAKRGVTVGASGLVVVISTNAVQAAPAGLAVTISTAAALAGTTLITTTTATVGKTIVMTTLQKALIALAITAVVGSEIYETLQASTLRHQVQTLQQQQAPLAEQLTQLQTANERLSNQAVLAKDSQALSKAQLDELMRLRGKSGVAQADARELATLKSTLADQTSKTQETPTVRFGSYIDAAGNAVVGKSSQATFEFENPSTSLVICAFHQPGGPRDMITGDPRDAIISLQPNSTNRVVLLVGQTNAETLSVKVMRAVSSRELSVPVP